MTGEQIAGPGWESESVVKRVRDLVRKHDSEIRRTVASLHAEDAPPFHLQDVIGLAVIGVGEFFFSDLLPRETPLTGTVFLRRDFAALGVVLACVPDLAARAGFIPGTLVLPGRAVAEQAWREYLRWGNGVLSPALREAEAAGWNPPRESRLGRLYYTWRDIVEESPLRPSRAQIEKAWKKINGLSEDEPVDPKVLSAAIRLIRTKAHNRLNVYFLGSGGGLMLGPRQVRDVLGVASHAL